MATQIILLERVESLGGMGEIVTVKPGFARNYLLPQGKALRATKENIAYFDAQKAHLTKLNNEKKSEAEAVSKKIADTKVVLIRQAAEGGQLFGSVTSRDIADALSEQCKQTVTRGMVALNQNFKTIGLFPVDVVLHPEVKVKVTVNIARTAEEAVQQAKTGKAALSDARGGNKKDAALDDAKADMLEEGALAAEKAEEAEEAKASAADAEKAAKKAASKKEKKVADVSDAEEAAE